MLPALLNLTASPDASSPKGTSNVLVTALIALIVGVVDWDGTRPNRYVALGDFSNLRITSLSLWAATVY